jgi:methyl-accepting chemotaxis protein
MAVGGIKLGLRGKLYLLAAVATAGLCTFGLLALNTLGVVKVSGPYYQSIVLGKDLVADILPPPEYLIEPYLVAFQMRDESDPQEMGKLIEKLQSLKGDYDTRHAYWQQNLPAGELKTCFLVNSYDPAVQFFKVVEDEFVPAARQGDRKRLAELLDGKLKASYRAHRVAIDQTVVLATEGCQKAEDDARSVVRSRSRLMLGLGAAICVAVLVSFTRVARGITRPLNRIITTLGDGANQVNAASGQVSSTSQQLAEGASEQACSLEKTSSALEQMAAMTRTNAENAKRASAFAGQARRAADEGDKSMAQFDAAMAGINDSSAKISKIIKVIEEIAFQTNLLALNAAVEAARAGEHGKGFAVVADEVRNLAQRAAQAARETTSLIGDAVQRTAQGAQVAAAVGKALGTIVGQAAQVSDLIDGIARASQEQAQGVDQVSSAVAQMDRVTQQNAAGAEQSAAAAEELAAQAQSVQGAVSELVAMVRGASAADAHAASAAPLPRPTGKKRAPSAAAIRKPGFRSTSPRAATEDAPAVDDGRGLDEF